jgi:AcrR family transcriptional regulator
MVVKPSSPKAVQGEATRQALVRAARELFGSRGYADTSLDAIVGAAGVTKGALYHHFSGKEELFRVVFEEVKRELNAKLRVILRAPDPWDPWAAIIAGCRTYIETHTDPAVQRIVLLDARAVLSHDAWRRVDSQWGAVMFRGAFRSAMNHGTMVRLPLSTLAMIVTGALTEACLLVANADDPDAARAEALTVVEHLLQGLRVTSSASQTSPRSPEAVAQPD